MSSLIIPLKGIYFDEIQSGKKLLEYRLMTPYWAKRLSRSYENVILTRGYPKKDDQSRRLIRQWRGYTVQWLLHPHFGDKPVRVYAIDVSAPLYHTKERNRYGYPGK
jgi:hypothetical protein